MEVSPLLEGVGGRGKARGSGRFERENILAEQTYFPNKNKRFPHEQFNFIGSYGIKQVLFSD